MISCMKTIQSVKMWICFNLSILLLCCATYGQMACTQPMVICVMSEEQAGCPNLNATSNTRDLSSISQMVLNCKMVRIFLTSGIHYLNETLTFSRTELEVHGESQSSDPSTVLCSNAGIGINNSYVTITNVVFENCSSLQSEMGMILIALNLNCVSITLKNVTVANSSGLGLYSYNGNMTLINCRFLHNSDGHVKIKFARKKNKFLVNISQSTFHAGSSLNRSGGLEIYASYNYLHLNISLSKCKFSDNEGKDGSHVMVKVANNSGTTLNFANCIFSGGRGSNVTHGVFLQSNSIRNNIRAILSWCNFTDNHIGGLKITQLHYIEVKNNWICNTTGTGIAIQKHSIQRNENKMVTNISQTHFSKNSKALYLNMTLSNNKSSQLTLITDCWFTDHVLPSAKVPSAAVYIKGNSYYRGIKLFEQGYKGNEVSIERSVFARNRNALGNCSTLLLRNMDNVVLADLSFHENKCTGIGLVASHIDIRRSLNLTGNSAISGGALRLERSPVPVKGKVNVPSVKFSTMKLKRDSQLNIINNTADKYGGGIFTDKTCEDRHCFFQLEEDAAPWNALRFIGNRAGFGGDAIFGGCLSNCSLRTTTRRVDISQRSNIVWDIISSKNLISQSTFAAKPRRVAFCTPVTSLQNAVDRLSCNWDTPHTMSVYTGQLFSVPLMVVDDSCSPSTSLIKAKLNASTAHLEEGQLYKKSSKNCSNYTYSITGQQAQMEVTIELTPANELNPSYTTTLLNVKLLGCPVGWKSENGACICMKVLKDHGIQCLNHTYSLQVPVSIWIGEVAPGRIALTRYCTYNCRRDSRHIIMQDITKDSDEICTPKRTGVLCGACISNLSLQLGGHECAQCSNSTYKGVLLVLGFMIIGIAMVLLLLSFNLTVSTGLVNGLIFYCNVVHLNSDILLPRAREPGSANSLHLNNMVRFLSTFQAWMNLDFGIVTCFFDGYDTYTSTWMQFVFPLYIWLLILIIVLASRYSKRISTITTSNTVSVLATLLLLSYAKLLKTLIEAASFTRIEFLNDSSKHLVWILDGNIPYLQGKHIPLFLMSLLTMVIYILPFTLLILLGPLLQAKSHYRLLNWINKLKPFLDAFYGPYTSRYRCWPGILLLVRVAILGTFAFYSLGDSPFKLMTVSVIVAALLVAWMLIGKTQNTSLHQKKLLNCLELFFLLNLAIFTVASIYHSQVTKNTLNQQGLAVGMVGSVLVAFCGILAYQFFCIISRYEAVRKIVRSLPINIKHKDAARKDQSLQDYLHSLNEISHSPTHSSVEITDSEHTDILREPLLTD